MKSQSYLGSLRDKTILYDLIPLSIRQTIFYYQRSVLFYLKEHFLSHKTYTQTYIQTCTYSLIHKNHMHFAPVFRKITIIKYMYISSDRTSYAAVTTPKILVDETNRFITFSCFITQGEEFEIFSE